MALNLTFSVDPHEILSPDNRWHPDREQEELFGDNPFRFLPPLVYRIRQEVAAWRKKKYAGASRTSRILLNHWFARHDGKAADPGDFRYYFAQREAVESVVYLYEVKQVKDCFDLMRFDDTGLVSKGMFEENWLRFVLKLATGAGKTKVMSLLIAWSYFHKLYEKDSRLSRNILLIAPNIIVLDRLKNDFVGLKIFREDPIFPEDGEDGRCWRDDFRMTVHLQDDIGAVPETGNLFLTNIHRVYEGKDIIPSFDDENTMGYFLGGRAVAKTTESALDLTAILKEMDELLVINDEAHHIHDEGLEWFKSIQHIDERLRRKGKNLSLQLDLTATPRKENGSIFVQTICDYPLAEAVSQDVVKRPVMPDAASRAKLRERESLKASVRYKDCILLGVEEWRKASVEHRKMNKKAILFVMTDNTRSCDEVALYLENAFPSEFKDKVLVIHTNEKGEFSEGTNKKDKEELDRLRAAANIVDSWESPYVAVVSVMMLKEGWDVRNVTTIVGLRSFKAKNKVLPEQALGRGLRKMYPLNHVRETLSVIGTDAFFEFVREITKDGGPTLDFVPMGKGAADPEASLVIEVDRENKAKDIDALDIELPVLRARLARDYEALSRLDADELTVKPLPFKEFGEDELREIVFRDIVANRVDHATMLESSFAVESFSDATGFFTKRLMSEMRLFSGYDSLFGQVKRFLRDRLFGKTIDTESRNALRNLAEPNVPGCVLTAFRNAINARTLHETAPTAIAGYRKVSSVKPFIVKHQDSVIPKKSVFNRIVSDRSGLELKFAQFLEVCPDVAAYAKNYRQINFKIDYIDADGNIAQYYPDFFVRTTDGRVYIVETKGEVDVNVSLKHKRLEQWIEDVNALWGKGDFAALYVSETLFEFGHSKWKTFAEFVQLCQRK